ncbi:hypothetical protein AB0N09_34470 [Streptomyces erythrochromogenes]|uniref:hypothetical protein n=1 Tax=Streptomyces erythrochromogenes TaxID=285574 RepID=UPI00342F6913
MSRRKRTLAAGAAFITLFAGYEYGDASGCKPASIDARRTPLAELKAIPVVDAPLGDAEDPVRILAEVRYRQSRLIAYVNGDSCGIVATSEEHSEKQHIHLMSKWPAGGEGTADYPAGPYNSASTAGGPAAWASMLCSKNAMVIEYTSEQDDGPELTRGQVTVTQERNTPPSSRIVIAGAGTRRQIENHYARGL